MLSRDIGDHLLRLDGAEGRACRIHPKRLSMDAVGETAETGGPPEGNEESRLTSSVTMWQRGMLSSPRLRSIPAKETVVHNIPGLQIISTALERKVMVCVNCGLTVCLRYRVITTMLN